MSKTKDQSETENTLLLELDKAGRYIEVRWHVELADGRNDEEYEPDRYVVLLSELEKRSDAVRNELAALEGCDWSDSEEARDRRTLHLQRLAEAGSDLYETVMTGAEDDGPSVRAAQTFREWFERRVLEPTDEWRIQVVHLQYDAPVVPWGLVFTPLKEGKFKQLGENVEDYSNFWALCFKLACRGTMRKEADRNYNKRREIDVMMALTVKADKEVLKRYTQGSAGRQKDVEHRVSTNVEEFERLPRAGKNFDIFWYIFLNEDGPGYHLGDEEIDDGLIDDIEERIENIMIMFLDGNAVIRGDHGVKWVQAMLKSGRTGLITAETDIRNEALFDFGWTLWKFVLKSKRPLIDAIDQARRKFWPKSLLYGVYCDPVKVFFDPPPIAEIQKADRFMKFFMSEIGENSRDKADEHESR